MPPFDVASFLRGLAERGPGKFLSKRLKANWHDLYRRFVEGPNFQPWFQRRRAAAEHEQHRAWRWAVFQVNMPWSSAKLRRQANNVNFKTQLESVSIVP